MADGEEQAQPEQQQQPAQAPAPEQQPAQQAPAQQAAPAPKKKPFGGYAINFAGRTETLEQVFGTEPIPPAQMTKALWAFIKANKLSVKG